MQKFKKSLALISMTMLILVGLLSPVLAVEPNTTEFLPSCTIAPGESKTVSLDIRNNDAAEHDYTLSTDGMINNDELYFSSGGTPVTTLTIPAGGSKQFDLTIGMKADSTAKADSTTIKAIRDDGQETTMKLTVYINQAYQLNITSLLDHIEILNGKSTEFTFSVKNSGANDLTAIKLKTELPSKWLVSQGADTSIDLKPGETGTIKITIDVPSSQIAGNTDIKVIAASNETQSNSVSIPATIKTSVNIAYWMIGLLLVIVVFTVIQFRKHGRR